MTLCFAYTVYDPFLSHDKMSCHYHCDNPCEIGGKLKTIYQDAMQPSYATFKTN